MMKKSVLFALLIFLLPGFAAAQVYLSPFGQYVRTDYANDAGLGLRVGYKIAQMHGLEAEYSYLKLSGEGEVTDRRIGTVSGSGDVTVHNFMGNYRFTLPLAQRLALYAGAGAGMTYIEADLTSEFGSGSAKDAVFTWQAFLGAEYYILPNLSASGGYRYQNYSDASFSRGNFSATFETGKANIIEIAATYYF